jgi:hypothetical protein
VRGEGNVDIFFLLEEGEERLDGLQGLGGVAGAGTDPFGVGGDDLGVELADAAGLAHPLDKAVYVLKSSGLAGALSTVNIKRVSVIQ